MARFSYLDVKASANPLSNWSRFVVHPFSDRVLWVLANFAPIHPTLLTITGGVLAVLGCPLFLRGDRFGLVGGAAAFYLSFATDTIDGALARLIHKTSKSGAWIDENLDFIRSGIMPAALAMGQFERTRDARVLYLGFGVVCVGLWHYLLAETSLRLTGKKPSGHVGTGPGRLSTLRKRLGLWSSPFTLAEYEAVCLVIFPLVGHPIAGMAAALALGTASRLAAFISVLRQCRNPVMTGCEM